MDIAVMDFCNFFQIAKKAQRYGSRALRLAKLWQRRVKGFLVLMTGSVRR